VGSSPIASTKEFQVTTLCPTRRIGPSALRGQRRDQSEPYRVLRDQNP
jgi:hypothetical protein